jgi:hypothetical protein
VVYLKPEYEHLVERVPSLNKLWESRLTMSEQDFAAYIFPDQSETCVAYGTAELNSRPTTAGMTKGRVVALVGVG